jgi:hypothetical protein
VYCSTSIGLSHIEEYKQQRGHEQTPSPNEILLGGTSGRLYPMTRMPLSARIGPKLSLQLINVGSNVPDRRESVLVGSSTTLAIATVFIVARLVSRVIIVRRTSWDDYFIIVAWVRLERLLEPSMIVTDNIDHCLRVNCFRRFWNL